LSLIQTRFRRTCAVRFSTLLGVTPIRQACRDEVSVWLVVMWKAIAFLQSEPIRSFDHYAIFGRSTAAAAKLSEAKTPQRKALSLHSPAANRKRTR